jgi:hypothetical protein
MDSEVIVGIGSDESAANIASSSADSGDIEMSPSASSEVSGLERAPPPDVPIDAGQSTAPAAPAAAKNTDDTSAIHPASRDRITKLMKTLISRMHSGTFPAKSAEELSAFKHECSTAGSLQSFDAAAFSQILSSLNLSPDQLSPPEMIDVQLFFYNYCGPLLLDDKIVSPDYFTDPSDPTNHTVHECIGPINVNNEWKGPLNQSSQRASHGCYIGEKQGQTPNGFGLWVNVDVEKEKGARPTGVTIMGGYWSDDPKRAFTGAMLHICSRGKRTSRMYPNTMERLVGFSYKGSLARDTTPDNLDLLTFSSPDADAVFREFEVALPSDGKDFPLQLWHELFIDALSDDGLERLFCRDVNRHAEALGVPFDFSQPWQRGRDQRALQDVLTSNYIGGGLQYFVPSIVKGTSYSIRYYYRLTSPHTHATRIALLTNSNYCQNRTPFAPF